VAYVPRGLHKPHGQLATWHISHMAKILNINIEKN
jgi:hypothetical protein